MVRDIVHIGVIRCCFDIFKFKFKGWVAWIVMG